VIRTLGSEYDKVREAASSISEQSPVDPSVGLILGSGLGELADEISNSTSVSYADLPGFQESTVEGHAGNLVLGTLENQSVCMMQGRYHFYEGHDPSDLIFPVRAMWGLGIETIVVTNASGAIHEAYEVGDLVLIEDHINALGTNPLIGPNDDEIGPRFVDMTYAYDRNLSELALDCANELGLDLKQGVYLATTGPSYETPAEIEMFETIGADLVGMSTVPEVIAANHCGMDVLGISCVTNMAAGVLDQPLDHDEVIETTERVKEDFKGLVRTILRSM
jgi:purine-nucleoside phosphorylase